MNKRRNVMDMLIIGIIGIAALIIGVMHFMSNKNPTSKKKSRRKKSDPWDDDPFFGTPLQKF